MLLVACPTFSKEAGKIAFLALSQPDKGGGDSLTFFVFF